MEAVVASSGADPGQRRFWAIGEVAAVFLIAAGVLSAVGSADGRHPLRHALAVVVIETLIMTLIWWSQRRRGLTLADLGLTFGVPDLGTVVSVVAWSVAVFAGTAGLFIAFAATMSLIAGEPQASGLSMYEFLRGNLWAMLGMIAAVWVTSSFAEEVIYRGFLINRLEEIFAGARRATLLAVMASGLVFGAIHYSWGPVGMLQTAVVGLALGTAYVRLGRRLWIVILVHGYLDTALFAQIYSQGAA